MDAIVKRVAAAVLLLALLGVAACGESDRDDGTTSRSDAELKTARSLIEAGRYAEARKALREAVRRHLKDERLVRELSDVEELLGTEKRPLERPPHSWVDGLRARVDEAEAARARGDARAAEEAARLAVTLVESAPVQVGDETLRHRIAELRRWLAGERPK